MKAATEALRTALKEGSALHVLPRLIGEWEYNRFLAASATISPDQTGDTDWQQFYGDATTIVKPFRPSAGIARARLDSGVAAAGKYRDSPNQTRYYPSFEYDEYSYWSSVQKTQLTPDSSGTAYAFDNPIVITVMYPQDVAANKIVVGYELGYCTPVSTSIQITSDSGQTWVTVATDAPMATDGTVTLWCDDNGNWSGNPVYDHPVVIQGVRLNIYSTNQPNTHVDVLQLGARLENDLTDYLIKYDVDFQASSPSFVAPFGKASTNQANITLSNYDGRFNNDNQNSLYYQMIDKKVRFTMDLGIDTSNYGGTGYEYVREFTMWADTWAPQTDGTTQVTCRDSSALLQEIPIPYVFIENKTTGGIIMEMLDRLGFNNYNYSFNEEVSGQIIPFFWPSDLSERSNPRWGRLRVSNTLPPMSTVWDEFSTMAESTQTAVFYDEYDVMQIVARDQMYGTSKTVDWNLDAVPNGQKLPDIVSTSTSYQLAANRIEVTYKNCSYSKDANGFPQMDICWQPITVDTSTAAVPALANAGKGGGSIQNGTSTKGMKKVGNSAATDVSSTDIVLRATSLTKDLLIGGTDLWINQGDAIIWQWEGECNIEGEILHYYGKEYGYYTQTTTVDGNGNPVGTTYTYNTGIAYSQTDQDNFDALSVDMNWKNNYTGRLLVTQRGLYGSKTADHKVSTLGNYYSMLTDYRDSVFQYINGYVTENPGYITMTTPVTSSSHADWNLTYHLRKHWNAVPPKNGSNTVWYGTRIRFPSGYAATPTSAGTASTPSTMPSSTSVTPSTPTNPSNPSDKPDLSTATSNWHLGGLHFAGDGSKAGYYLEITPTGQIDGWEKRTWRNEVCLLAKSGGNGGIYQVPGDNASTTDPTTGKAEGDRGYQVGILEDAWYEVEVKFYEDPSTGNHLISAFVNGVSAGSWTVPPANQPKSMTNEWRFGTFVRGPVMGVDYEYLFAFAQDDTNPALDPDQTSFLDLATGSYASGFVSTNLKYPNNSVYWQTNPPSSVLKSGQVFYSGASIYSGNGLFHLDVQGDGNLVVYGPSGPLWNSGTAGDGTVHLAMQGDGSLVLYNSTNRALWNAATQNNPGAYAVMQNDGNFVVYDRSNKPLWASNTETLSQDAVLDEYSPVVHEVRTFDIEFDKSKIPVSSSFLYLTNSGKVDCLSYQSDAFGAEFMLANASRDDVVVNGSDTLTAPGQSIDQAILVYGRCVYVANNDAIVIKANDDWIRRQGLIRTQLTTRYIQTDDMANDIAQWILDVWDMGIDEVSVACYGNPLFQIGDLVTVNYPAKGMDPNTHFYYVIDVKNTFESGYATELTLRRAKLYYNSPNSV